MSMVPTSILTRGSFTVVDIYLAVLALEAFSACTDVSTKSILTGAAMLTRVAVTLINLVITVTACITRGTAAYMGVSLVHTDTSVMTHLYRKTDTMA